MDWLIDGINEILLQIGDAGRGVLEKLPASPLQWQIEVDNQILRWLNWIIPIGEMVVVAQGWLICILIWYAVRWLMRWLKAAAG